MAAPRGGVEAAGGRREVLIVSEAPKGNGIGAPGSKNPRAY